MAKRKAVLKAFVVLLASSLVTCATTHKQSRRVGEPPPLEDELGVAGGPVDQTAFVWEPESDTIPKLELQDVDETSPETAKALAPYLQLRRTRLQTLGGDASWVVYITRKDQTAQAFRMKEPEGEAVALTKGKDPVTQISGVPKTVDTWMYRSDVSGNEKYQILRAEGDEKPTFVSDGVSRSGPFGWAPSGDRIAFTSNRRNGADMDVYVSDGKSSKSAELVMAAPGAWSVSSWSPDGSRLMLRQYLSFARSAMYVLDLPTGRRTQVTSDTAAHFRGRFSDNSTAFITSDREGEFVDLWKVNFATGSWVNVSPAIPWNIEEVTVASDGNSAVYTINEDGLSTVMLLDLVTATTSRIHGIPPGIVHDLRLTRSKGFLGFTLDQPTMPGSVYTLNLETQELTSWTAKTLAKDMVAPARAPELVKIQSFDNIAVPAWVYRPEGKGPHPVVIWIHGGPEQQFVPSFNPLIQYFVQEAGIAVVAPNIRGSNGYGKTYLTLDDGMKRQDAIKDVGAILDWIDNDPHLDGQRTGIYGGSYGGYVVLASLVMYPDRFSAGVDLVGISNFVTFLENTSAYRRDQRRVEYGDERDPAMREYLSAISPANNADKIRAPLFVAHGANDPRVPLDEARQIVEAVRKNGNEAWLMVAGDEGHGFRKRRNRDAFYEAMVTFFQKHLRERRPLPAVPIDDSVPDMGDAGSDQ
jgi:dipeptidyl aminopeptidase/acylaminoacyl peptidase